MTSICIQLYVLLPAHLHTLKNLGVCRWYGKVLILQYVIMICAHAAE